MRPLGSGARLTLLREPVTTSAHKTGQIWLRTPSLSPPAAGCGLILYYYSRNGDSYNPNAELRLMSKWPKPACCVCEPWRDLKRTKVNLANKTSQPLADMQNKLFNRQAHKSKASDAVLHLKNIKIRKIISIHSPFYPPYIFILFLQRNWNYPHNRKWSLILYM